MRFTWNHCMICKLFSTDYTWWFWSLFVITPSEPIPNIFSIVFSLYRFLTICSTDCVISLGYTICFWLCWYPQKLIHCLLILVFNNFFITKILHSSSKIHGNKLTVLFIIQEPPCEICRYSCSKPYLFIYMNCVSTCYTFS